MTNSIPLSENLMAALSDPKQTAEQLLELAGSMAAEQRDAHKIIKKEITYEDRYDKKCASGWASQRCLTLTYDDGATATNCSAWSCK